MKTLNFLITGSLALAIFSGVTTSTAHAGTFGTPGQDPNILNLREQFKSATSVQETDLALGKKWKCVGYAAIRDNYESAAFEFQLNNNGNIYDMYISVTNWFNPNFAELDYDRNGVIVLKTQGVKKGRNTYKTYFRVLNGNLIGEALIDMEGSNAIGSVSVPGASVTDYYSCKLAKNDRVEI